MFKKSLIIVLAVFFQAFSYSHPARGLDENTEELELIAADGHIYLIMNEGLLFDDHYAHRHRGHYKHTIELNANEYLEIKNNPQRFSFFCRWVYDWQLNSKEDCSRYIKGFEQ